MIGNCSTDSLFALVLSSVISPHDKIGLNEVQERYRGVVGGPQKLCVVISVKKADSNNFCFVIIVSNWLPPKYSYIAQFTL